MGSLRPTTTACFFSATNRLSQSAKNKEAEDTNQKTKEAAQAVKEGAEEVKKTAKVIRDATKSTAKTINTCAEAFKESLVSGAVNTAKATTEIIKDKVVGK